MRRQRKKRIPLTVSLFPFLAVLICTLGALIILLVLAVKAAESGAVQVDAERAEENAANLAQLELELDEHAIRAEGLLAMRPDMTKRISDVKSFRGRVDGEIARIKRNREKLVRELESLNQVEQASSLSQVNFEAEREQLKATIQQASAELEETRKKAILPERVTYSIVPHSGPSGTFRRPIYIECVSNRVVLQPFEITLGKDDFLHPEFPDNPLDAALLKIREYWTQYDSTLTQGKPYPLLVVRPDGANAYAAARRAMSSWDDEFGYELVESGLELNYGPPDPTLKNELFEVVENARKKQKRIASLAKSAERMRAMQESRRRGNSPGGRGGYELVRGPQGGKQLVALSSPVGSSGQFKGKKNRGTKELDEFFGRSSRQVGSEQPGNEQPGNEQVGAKHKATATGAQARRSGQIPSANNESSNQQAQSSKAFQNRGQGGASQVQSSDAMSASRGQDWALPKRTRGGTAYVRPITVICSGNKITLRSAGRVTASFPIQNDVAEVIDPMVDRIWKMIDQWGIAGDGGYWRPVLKTKIIRGGEAHFHRFANLLEGSGLDVKEVR